MLFGVLADRFDPEPVLVVSGFLYAALALGTLASRSVRNLENDLVRDHAYTWAPVASTPSHTSEEPALAVSIKEIRLFGGPILRTPAVEVVDFDRELRQPVADLTDTMVERPERGWPRRRSGSGCGFSHGTSTAAGHLVNPVLRLSDDCQDGLEGCLSIPGVP